MRRGDKNSNPLRSLFQNVMMSMNSNQQFWDLNQWIWWKECTQITKINGTNWKTSSMLTLKSAKLKDLPMNSQRVLLKTLRTKSMRPWTRKSTCRSGVSTNWDNWLEPLKCKLRITLEIQLLLTLVVYYSTSLPIKLMISTIQWRLQRLQENLRKPLLLLKLKMMIMMIIIILTAAAMVVEAASLVTHLWKWRMDHKNKYLKSRKETLLQPSMAPEKFNASWNSSKRTIMLNFAKLVNLSLPTSTLSKLQALGSIQRTSANQKWWSAMRFTTLSLTETILPWLTIIHAFFLDTTTLKAS